MNILTKFAKILNFQIFSKTDKQINEFTIPLRFLIPVVLRLFLCQIFLVVRLGMIKEEPRYQTTNKTFTCSKTKIKNTSTSVKSAQN